MDNRTYAMLAKPASSTCNLRCEYCYYAGKNKLLHVENSRMSQDILETYTRQSLDMYGRDAVVEFAWHGGEPTIAGISFYEEALRLQRKYGKGRKILNTLQTNATLLNDDWCRFFKANNFLIGVSIDGPEPLHNAYRKTVGGRGSFTETMRGIELLQKHRVSFNTLTTVNRINMEQPLDLYRFLRELTDFLQFLPVVECMPAQYETEDGQLFATPPGLYSIKIKHRLTDFSVTSEGYGAFLCAIWDEWNTFDSEKKHIQLFDVTIGNLRGILSSLCVHNPLCGHSGCVEANGDVYACDRYAFPAYKLGNITRTSLGELMELNRDFGMHKTYGLPEECLDCRYIKLCFGGCPKDRLWDSKNYLCAGYKMFFDKVLRS